MKVLSLFDGISCGQVALKKIGIKPTIYFASEIDRHAIACAIHNHPDTIQLGDVVKVREMAEAGLFGRGEIDLLLAGSPCQGFSLAGAGLNFANPRSALFFEFVRIKNAIAPKNFLLENVKMKKLWQDVISLFVGVEPHYINSSDFSAQQRPRLYWTDISLLPYFPKNIIPFQILDFTNRTVNSDSWHRWFERNKIERIAKDHIRVVNNASRAICLTARSIGNWNGNIYDHGNRTFRFISVLESERLQTLPDGYCASMREREAYKALGNGWTVDVIAHILKGLRK